MKTGRGEELRELRRMQEKMSHRLAGAVEEEAGDEAAPEVWQPAADIYEDDAAYVIRLELPGLDQNQVEVLIEEQTLIVRGERLLAPQAGVIFRRIENSYGPFARSFVLPASVEVEEIQASCERGLLEVRLPKGQRKGGRRIEIEG